jgi:hypothetical protein
MCSVKRRLFNVLAAVSLVLCVATAYLVHNVNRWETSWGGQHQRTFALSFGDVELASYDPPRYTHFSLLWVFTGALPFPVLWMMDWGRSRYLARVSRRSGLCPACGYDLRATPDRCPECGSPAQPKPAAAIATPPANGIER